MATPALRSVAHEGVPFLDPKLAVPTLRRGAIQRQLVARLVADPAQLVMILAPPGYGKTTLLGQWVAAESRETAWVTIDSHDDDPAALLSWLATALGQIDPSVAARGPARAPSVRAVGLALSRLPPTLLVLEDFHRITARPALDVIAELATYVPQGSCLAVCERRPSLSLGELRTQVAVLELGVDDLAFGLEEARGLFDDVGATVDDPVLEGLVARSEGWPAALYLAARSMRSEASVDLAGFGGDNRVIAAYLESQVKDELPPQLQEFLLRTSVLRNLSGPLCDDVLQDSGGAVALEELAASTRLVVPVGPSRSWYRYHVLLREFLLSELVSKDPADAVQLRRRASDWWAREGGLEQALHYAAEAGDDDRIADLMLRTAQPLWASGRTATVETWLGRLQTTGMLDVRPELSSLWGFLLALAGRATEAERWIDHAAKGEASGPLPDGSATLAAWHARDRALLCRDGPAQMLQDSEDAIKLLAPSSVFLATALCLRGMAALMSGDQEAAKQSFDDTVEVASSSGAHAVRSVALAELALLASDAGRWDVVAAHVDAATSIVTANSLEWNVTSAITYAAAARLAVHRGDDHAAEQAMLGVARLRPSLSWSVPHLAVQVRIVAVGVHLARREWDAARTVLAETRELLRRRPQLGCLGEQVDVLGTRVQAGRGGATAAALTAAELRLLPYLSTHLSFRGIGERLFLSPHTIKTQALSIYRKLSASSRAEAVARARQIGLLEP